MVAPLQYWDYIVNLWSSGQKLVHMISRKTTCQFSGKKNEFHVVNTVTFSVLEHGNWCQYIPLEHQKEHFAWEFGQRYRMNGLA